MSIRKAATLPSALGAVALTLALALSACGSKPEATDADTSSAAAGEEPGDAAAEGQFAFSDDAVDAANIVKLVAQSGDTTGANQLDALPASENEALSAISGTDELTEGETADAKAPANKTRLPGPGIQMLIPSTWLAGYASDDTLMFASPDETVVGCIEGAVKPSGSHYDLEGMVKAIPSQVAAQGYTDVQVVGLDTGYSSKGTLCSAYICMTATKDGIEHTHYVQFVESKSYLNAIQIIADTPDFEAHLTEINEILSSVQFNADEVI